MNCFNPLRFLQTAAVRVALVTLPAAACAQGDLPSVPVTQLTRPVGWQVVGSVAAGPDGTSLKTQPGSTVLVGSREPLTLATPTDDFRLRFDWLTTAGANVTLSLPGNPPIAFAQSRELARLLKAPGLWQTVEVWYKPGNAPKPPVLEKLVLNGVTVREGQTLTGKAPATSPVTVQATSGSVAVRNVGYRVMSPRAVARWSGPLSYTIYEGENGKRADLTGKKILKQDTSSLVNYEVAYGQPRRYSILFAGRLDALQAGDYTFDLHQGGIAGLYVDGNELIPATYHDLSQPETRTTRLTAGPHDVVVFFTRSWARPGLGLFVSQAGTRPQSLHTPASLPDPDPVGVISVEAGSRPQLIRSFVQMPGEPTKRTHSLSVGSPAGRHYTLDLNQMALLQVWKGDFADVTEMWYERGEPQLLTPMGATVRLSARSALAVLPDDLTTWPDSLGENVLRYKGLTIDKTGQPTIEYTLAGTTVTDALRTGPDGSADNGLTRTLTVSGSPNGTVYCRVAAGTSLDEVSKGLYAVDDRSYYVRFDPKAKIKLRHNGNQQDLLIPVVLKNGTGSITYSIVF